jgi:hypothetical protein
MSASSVQEVAVALPLIVCVVMMLITIAIHAIALIAVIYFIRYHHRLGHTGIRHWQDVAIITSAILLAGVAHLVEIFIWSVVFVLCGQFGSLSAAFYNSAMFYTALGCGEEVMSSSWKLLAPFETADGMLAFGVSIAIVISVIQLMIRTRFRDLPNF